MPKHTISSAGCSWSPVAILPVISPSVASGLLLPCSSPTQTHLLLDSCCCIADSSSYLLFTSLPVTFVIAAISQPAQVPYQAPVLLSPISVCTC
ncbi:hypothetical protein GDO86_009074 [Hymenochirus boettgeri]|uniref:Uncharacterized protein n=1 Tax=Hymenochirus boettgeri TaxID=247094 RepID=A0A8T2JEL0_9PIPI|nr:hypothetical protein GDO86_009074 [Hymenochirus boettgeri]